MKPDEIKSYGCVVQHLTDEEINSFQHLINRLENEDDQEDLITIRDRYAERGRLMEKHKKCVMAKGHGFVCPECLEHPCKPDCLWAQAIFGGGGVRA